MAVLAITGASGAPGATSAALALLLSWPLADGRRVLLLECDPDGGAILAGALQGRVEAAAGLRNLALADRRGRLLEAMWEQCLDVSPGQTGDRLLLPGLSDPAQAAALAPTWAPLAHACQSLDAYGCDVIVDLGRSGGLGPAAPMVRRADAVLAVLRTTLRGLSAARPRVAALAADLAAEGGGADALGLLLVQEGPYSASEISRALQAPVLGLLPFAPKEAHILSDGGRTADRRFQRSHLMRAARSTADEVRALIARRRLRSTVPQAAAPTVPAVQSAATAPQSAAAVPPSVPGAPVAPAPGYAAPLTPVGPPLPPYPGPAAPAGPAPGQSAAGASPLGYREALRGQPPAWSVQDVLDLAASAQLAEGDQARPPAQPRPVPPVPPGAPGAPVTPGQAARLRAVHMEQQGRAGGAAGHPHPEPEVEARPSYRPGDPGAEPVPEDDRDWFTPMHTSAPPPLAEHAPRPPAPEPFRPPESVPPSGEVAHVR